MYRFIVVFSILVIGITIIYTGAFIQGREISFWPPKISAKPSQLQNLSLFDNDCFSNILPINIPLQRRQYGQNVQFRSSCW